MIGRVFLGRYEVQRLLGEGGMGRVYLARQTDLGRQVVIKVMHEHIAADTKFRDRFQRETLLMARFHHPYAVTLYDASLNDPAGPCIIMEYVKGTNLETLLAKNKRLAAPRVGRIINQLCEVLQAAHEEGIIHRDLKPANLMLLDADTPRERIKVMDFGLAKLVEQAYAHKVTDTNIDFAVGTPGYICPEQVRGESMDHRGDIYSVGVMMYELLSGQLPFQGATSMDVLLAHATEMPPTFEELGIADWVPKAIEELVFDCLAKSPDDRPASSRELAGRFEKAIAEAQIQADSRAQMPGLPDLVLDNEPPVPLSLDTPTLSARSTPSRSVQTGRDLGALPFQMEAWMPETIAVIKLRGFVQDCGGEVLDYVPGLIRVRIGKSRTPTTTSWFGFTRRVNGPIDVELHLHRENLKQENHLSIQVLFRPSHPSLLADDSWKARCNRHFVEIRAYLMGSPSSV